MDKEKFLELISTDNYKFFKEDGIFEGSKILSKYTNRVIQAAEHDIVYSEDISELINQGITEKEVVELRKLGWFAEYEDCLAYYV